ncbi:MarR family transcriptional regulator [Ramlibacter sp.]|uniref:MarR family winged helix-turn-helix transcriptional regulator n=1 Tax=Ramlibacter sp. TaxID=1917967 RepID=UPI002D2D8924|nr:MarR family transcriptional regulator [Ramlibacter sp.]HYD75153.1 MarR family transcriptional regulator [Ramlibacter sp.]
MSKAPIAPELDQLPGYSIRRLQQIAVALFLQETEVHGITPVQYAALHTVCRSPGIDQRTLAAAIGLDTSTTGGVIDRLEAKGALQRSPSEHDRRVRLLTATEEGQALAKAVAPAMLRAQERILAPLPAKDRKEFLRMLRVLVEANNELSRAPSSGI